MIKLTREQWIPFLDIAKDSTFTANLWKRIDLSTQFELTMGENEEDKDYICNKDTIMEVTSNNIEFPQEIACYEGNAIFDFMKSHFFNMPTYTECEVPFLICYAGTDKIAWRGVAVISGKSINAVDGVITFTIRPKAPTIVRGTWTITDGTPTFTPTTQPVTVTLTAGAGTVFKNLAGSTITSLSLQPGEIRAIKVAKTQGSGVSGITVTNSESEVVPIDANGCLYVPGKTDTLTSAVAPVNKNKKGE